MLGLALDDRGPRRAEAALRAEADGGELRTDLADGFYPIARGAVPEIQSGLMSVGHSGIATNGEPLRASVAAGVSAERVKTARTTGAAVRVAKTPGLRGFTHAAKRLNRARFRRPVYGRGWVEQEGNANYFELPMIRRAGQFRAAAEQSIERMARRIKRRTDS